MLRQSASRCISRTVLAAPAAAASSSRALSGAILSSAVRASSSHPVVVASRPCAVSLAGQQQQARAYSIDIVRKTDFADQGPIAFDEVKQLTETPGKAVILDVRELNEIQQGNIPSSLPLPLSKLPEALKMEPSEFETTFGFRKPEPDQPIVVYCRSGKRSASAKEQMEALPAAQKFTNIRNYNGSWLDWSAKFQPKEDKFEDDD